MAATGTSGPLIHIPSLPDISKAEVDFHDTSFFNTGQIPLPQLPTPASILQQHPGTGVIKFEHLNLAVKVKRFVDLRLEEAQTMRAIRQAFPHNEIPVPEVFGWRSYKGRNFLYMSLIRGPTLHEAWSSLTEADKETTSSELSCIVTTLRQITQGSPSRFIGSVNGGSLQDRYFKPEYELGPLHSIKSFNDLLLTAAVRNPPGSEPVAPIPGLYREFLSDIGEVYFAHGDLTLGNIIVSGIAGCQKIVGIIDWEQSGWYPEYWEYCKLLYGVKYTHEWRSAGWAAKVMKPFEDEWTAFSEYSLWRCP